VIPHTKPAESVSVDPGKFASTLRSEPEGCAIALLGLPDDTGVRLNGGRPGAAEGPRAFRQALTRYGVAQPPGIDWPRVFNAGDIIPAAGADAAALHETHARITNATAMLAGMGMIVVGIGGGHDLTFPCVRGVATVHGSMQGVYYDAHLDVRETDGSGMPFRRLIECKACKSLTLHGFNPFVNSRSHSDWFTSNGGRFALANSEFSLDFPTDRAFVSVDLDSIDSAQAPGVSAINPCGLDVDFVARGARQAGRDPRVKCFDIMELCPVHDNDGRTARVAAHLFLSFLRGVSERS